MTTVCKNIVIVNGWGAQTSLWDEFSAQLNTAYNIKVIDLPCTENALGNNFSLGDLAELLNQNTPAKAHFIGWSLGGNIALQLALKHCEKVASLLTIGCSPKFVQGDGWTDAMPVKTFDSFYQSVLDDGYKALKLFAGLQAIGGENERAVLKKLRRTIGTKDELDAQVLATGLRILGSNDQRNKWAEISCPVKHLYGQFDNLVPAAVAEFSPTNSVVLAGCGHAPMVSAPAKLAAIAQEFIRCGL